MQTISTILAGTRNDLRARGQRRAQQRRLLQELASYTSPSDRLELDTIIARAPRESAVQLEAIVSRSRAAA